MPELPEVETIKNQLNKVLPGLKILGVEIRLPKMFEGDPKELVGREVVGVERVGKMILVKLKVKSSRSKTGGKVNLLIHLKLTGRLIFGRKEYQKDKHTHIIIKFSNGRKLYFWDLRKFGWMRVINQISNLKSQKWNLGPDPLSKDFTLDYLKKILSSWGRPVKLLLLQQKKIAGIGNIYANEALFCAGIAPHHRGRELVRDHPEKVAKLYKCIQKVLKKGIKYRGASDNSYRLIDGSRGAMQEHFWVYGKAGQPCPNKCGKIIRRMTLSGRGSFFCPRCQR